MNAEFLNICKKKVQRCNTQNSLALVLTEEDFSLAIFHDSYFDDIKICNVPVKFLNTDIDS